MQRLKQEVGSVLHYLWQEYQYTLCPEPRQVPVASLTVLVLARLNQLEKLPVELVFVLTACLYAKLVATVYRAYCPVGSTSAWLLRRYQWAVRCLSRVSLSGDFSLGWRQR